MTQVARYMGYTYAEVLDLDMEQYCWALESLAAENWAAKEQMERAKRKSSSFSHPQTLQPQ